jgi:hypothetical protein
MTRSNRAANLRTAHNSMSIMDTPYGVHRRGGSADRLTAPFKANPMHDDIVMNERRCVHMKDHTYRVEVQTHRPTGTSARTVYAQLAATSAIARVGERLFVCFI